MACMTASYYEVYSVSGDAANPNTARCAARACVVKSERVSCISSSGSHGRGEPEVAALGALRRGRPRRRRVDAMRAS